MQFGPGFLPTFLYYFTSTAILITLIASKGMGFGMDTGLPQQLGLAGGVIAGGLGAYFNRTTTLSVQFRNRKTFFNELERTLKQLGYQRTSEDEGLYIYERSNLSKWLSGKIFVQMEGNSATIASRATNIRQLQKVI